MTQSEPKVTKLKIYDNGVYKGEVRPGEIFEMIPEDKLTFVGEALNHQTFETILGWTHKPMKPGDVYNPHNNSARIHAE